MWYYVFDDICMALSYLPLGILTALGMLCIICTYKKAKRKKMQWDRIIYFALFVVYAIAVVQIAYFSREPGSRNSIDLTLFDTWGNDPISRSYVIENVIMFIPFGILVPAIWNKMRALYRCILAAFISTVCIETMQLLTQRGYCQLDDVVMNTLGGIIGYGIFFIVFKVVKYIRD